MVFNIKINRGNETYFLLKNKNDDVESIKKDLQNFSNFNKLEFNEMRLYFNSNVK